MDDEGCFLDTIYVGLGDNEVTADFVIDSLEMFPVLVQTTVVLISVILMAEFYLRLLLFGQLLRAFCYGSGLPIGGFDDIDNLFGGTWTVTVKDEEGCAWSHLFTEPDLLTIVLF